MFAGDLGSGLRNFALLGLRFIVHFALFIVHSHMLSLARNWPLREGYHLKYQKKLEFDKNSGGQRGIKQVT